MAPRQSAGARAAKVHLPRPPTLSSQSDGVLRHGPGDCWTGHSVRTGVLSGTPARPRGAPKGGPKRAARFRVARGIDGCPRRDLYAARPSPPTPQGPGGFLSSTPFSCSARGPNILAGPRRPRCSAQNPPCSVLTPHCSAHCPDCPIQKPTCLFARAQFVPRRVPWSVASRRRPMVHDPPRAERGGVPRARVVWRWYCPWPGCREEGLAPSLRRARTEGRAHEKDAWARERRPHVTVQAPFHG